MTKTELIEQLGTSRGTLYRHMNKLGINKGSKLTNEEIKRITISIKGDTSILQNNTKEIRRQNENDIINNENGILKEEIDYLKKRIEQLELDNRNLMQELSNSLVMHNEVNKQYSNFMIEMKSLMAPREIIDENPKKENDIDETSNVSEFKEGKVKENSKVKKEEKKRKWWQR